jgi:hypothetical protein
MKNHVAFLAIALGIAAVLLPAGKAQAIPAFARLYKTECNTCHTIFPDRKPFGEAFRRNSYVWPGKLPEQMQEEVQYTPRKTAAFQGMSSSGQEKPKPQAGKWLTAIPDQVPISLWVNHDLVYNKRATRTTTDLATGTSATVPATEFDLDGLTELEMFTGGSFRGKAGWWAEYNFAPDHDIGEVYIQLRHLLGSPVNFKVGRFKAKLSLWKDNDSATISDYGFNDYVVGAVNTAAGQLTGNPFTITQEKGGLELNSLVGNHIFLAGGIQTPPEKTVNGPFYYGHAELRFGGVDLAGNDPEVSLESESIWENLALTFAGFYYNGTSLNEKLDPTSNAFLKFKNNFYRAGVESDILFKNLRFRLSAIQGEDKNPQGPDGLGVSERSRFYTAQGQYIFLRDMLVAMRYELQEIEHEGNTRRFIPTYVFAPWQNVRVALEYVHEIDPHIINLQNINRIYTCRFTFAF